MHAGRLQKQIARATRPRLPQVRAVELPNALIFGVKRPASDRHGQDPLMDINEAGATKEPYAIDHDLWVPVESPQALGCRRHPARHRRPCVAAVE